MQREVIYAAQKRAKHNDGMVNLQDIDTQENCQFLGRSSLQIFVKCG